MDDRSFVKTIKQASLTEFSEVLRTDDPQQKRVLQLYFGTERYFRMRDVAFQLTAPKYAAKRGTVFVLPGILGCELWEPGEEIWLNPWSIIKGDFFQLGVQANGSSCNNITHPHPLWFVYGELELYLSLHWNVVPFPFDWRMDIKAAAKDLKAKVDTLPSDEPRYFVTHSMGGLVVRMMLQLFKDEKRRLSRLILIGVPNRGTFVIPMLSFGLNGVLDLIARADIHHPSKARLLQLVKMFIGTYEMLPFVDANPAYGKLLTSATYGKLAVPQDRLDNAGQFQTVVMGTLPLHKIFNIAGFGYSTPCDILDWTRMDSPDGYSMTNLGDGNVPHSLGLISGATTYFVHAKHSWLPTNHDVIRATEEILDTGATSCLPRSIPTGLKKVNEKTLRIEWEENHLRAEIRVDDLRDQLFLRRMVRAEELGAPAFELQRTLYSGDVSRHGAEFCT